MILHLWCSDIVLRQRYCCFATVILRLCRSCGIFKFSDCARSALHQADNLAKLRREILSVPELIAQILCAVSKAINRARFLAIRIYAIVITSATIFARNRCVPRRRGCYACISRFCCRLPLRVLRPFFDKPRPKRLWCLPLRCGGRIF